MSVFLISTTFVLFREYSVRLYNPTPFGGGNDNEKYFTKCYKTKKKTIIIQNEAKFDIHGMGKEDIEQQLPGNDERFDQIGIKYTYFETRRSHLAHGGKLYISLLHSFSNNDNDK